MDKVDSSKAPPPENPPAPQQPAESSEKLSCCPFCSKPIRCLLLVILIVAALVGAGYYLLAARRAAPVVLNQQPPVTPMPTPTPLPSRASATEGDPTANWKTYVNEKYGFEFQYPQSEPIREGLDDQEGFYFVGLGQNDKFGTIKIDENNVSLNDFTKNVTSSSSRGYWMDIMVSGVPSYTLTTSKSNRGMVEYAASGKYVTTLIFKNSYGYIVSFEGDEMGTKTLFTFKFD